MNYKTKNNQILRTCGIIGGFFFALIIIPVLLTLLTNQGALAGDNPIISQLKAPVDDLVVENKQAEFGRKPIYINLKRVAQDRIEVLELEQYLIGVVAAEMPALFHLEALKAQAVVARTYAMKILSAQDYITDTTTHQVYWDEETMKARWGDDFAIHHATISEAVRATTGLVLKYDGQLITAMFFSMSGGATVNSEDMFSTYRPYLRSVESVGYDSHPRFNESTLFTIAELQDAFSDTTITKDNVLILSRCEGGSVAEITLGQNTYSGRDVRETLGLRSATFEINSTGHGVTFVTSGWGHGVGMSQFGADAMGRNGSTFDEILFHYYQNVILVEIN